MAEEKFYSKEMRKKRRDQPLRLYQHSEIKFAKKAIKELIKKEIEKETRDFKDYISTANQGWQWDWKK